MQKNDGGVNCSVRHANLRDALEKAARFESRSLHKALIQRMSLKYYSLVFQVEVAERKQAKKSSKLLYSVVL